MDQNIEVKTEILENKIALLKTERDKLADIFGVQKDTTEKMNESWGGTNGEKAQERLKKHYNKYETWIDKIDERIEFLQKIVDAYKNADNTINNKIDSNADIGA